MPCGKLQLTDFGLSRVGLINSTDDFSGPAASGRMLMEKAAESQNSPNHSRQRERRQQQSAVGTPDYLAPEILLGTSHGKIQCDCGLYRSVLSRSDQSSIFVQFFLVISSPMYSLYSRIPAFMKDVWMYF